MSSGPRNVVLLTLDALRADHVSWCGYDRDTTPNFDRFAETNTRFAEAYSVSTHTREAIPGLLTGLYPTECVADDYSLAADTIATHLRDTEYTTGAFHSNPYVSRAYGFDQDFDTFDDDLYLGQHKLIALAQRALDKVRNRHYARAETINERALSFVDSTEEPFFLWSHYMDPHGPYSPPREYQTVYHDEYVGMKCAQEMYRRAAVTDPESITEAERQEMVNLYDEEIRYADAQLGAFLDGLEKRGLLEETMVIVTADHGDAFGEHGYYGHPRQLNDELLRVPLAVSAPGMSAEVPVPVSTADVVPTVLETADVSSGKLPGESLFVIAESPGTFSDRVVFSQVQNENGDRRRYVARGQGKGCLMERATGTGDVTVEPSETKLGETLRAHSSKRSGTQAGNDEREGGESNKNVERRLEALGYK